MTQSSGRTILIAGGVSDIGRQLTLKTARQGAQVVSLGSRPGRDGPHAGRTSPDWECVTKQSFEEVHSKAGACEGGRRFW
jgi:NAD(P)-dependent dehydrogenase (short-subunit alcohol dehydrogenase family)